MSLREKKKQETKKRIFQVASKLFKEKGYENTTVDEITREAGIAKGTFFNYFRTKEELLVYFGQQKEDLIKQLIKDEMKKNSSTKEKIKNVLTLLAMSIEEDKELAKTMVFAYIKNAWMGTNQGSNSEKLARILLKLLKEGQKKREIKSELDIRVSAENLTAIYFTSLMRWLKSERDYSFSEDISKKIDQIFNGIGG